MIEAKVTYEVAVSPIPVAGYTAAEAEKPGTTVKVERHPVYVITDQP